MDLTRILFVSDTHLDFDLPRKPRIARRRRRPDFFDNFNRALEPARRREVDLVIHGGDILYRSRVPAELVHRAFAPLKEIAALGIPVYVVPGNHERSRIPFGLLAQHENVFLFDRTQDLRACAQELSPRARGVSLRAERGSKLPARGREHGLAQRARGCYLASDPPRGPRRPRSPPHLHRRRRRRPHGGHSTRHHGRALRAHPPRTSADPTLERPAAPRSGPLSGLGRAYVFRREERAQGLSDVSCPSRRPPPRVALSRAARAPDGAGPSPPRASSHATTSMFGCARGWPRYRRTRWFSCGSKVKCRRRSAPPRCGALAPATMNISLSVRSSR